MERIEKVNQLMKREISLILQQEFQDPRLTFVTILSVEVSRDLQHAHIYYSVLGDEKQIGQVSKILKQLSSYIRKLVGQRVRLRYTPEVLFIYDNTIQHTAQLEQTFEEIHQREAGSPPADKNSPSESSP